LEEFVLLEGLSTREADLLLRLAATLRRPAGGRIFHWGRDLFALSRRALYPWRGRLAFVSPFQSLLPRLTVLENVTLYQTLTTPRSAAAVGREHRELLEQLALSEYLSRFPRELPTRQYHLALWARELIKQPHLILGVMAGQEEPFGAPSLLPHLVPLFDDYRSQRRGAIVLAGPFLEPVHPVADRMLFCQGDHWREQPLPGRRDQPLLNYLNLI
jgi:ABC-type glutathione transport system ATPase component